ncbi:MAG: alcohol acetyltransferase [Christensenellales bacterium]
MMKIQKIQTNEKKDQDKQYNWLKLDNAAKIYPAAMSRSWNALFRLSAKFIDPIDPQLLEQAQRTTLKRFPGFALKLRRGIFWYYLERLKGEPKIQQDVGNPCVRMNLRENDGFMFRVRYYENRIAVEIFHVLTDGAGGLSFLKTLAAEYATLKYGVFIPRSGDILDCSETPKDDELEDSYLKYARKATISRKESVAYRIRGTEEERYLMNIVTGSIPLEAISQKAKSFHVSVGEFLTAALIQAVYRIQQKDHHKKWKNKPVKVCVPVNLRKFYPTNTMRNFASYVNPGIHPKFGVYTFNEILEIVKHFMRLEVTEKMMNARISTNVKTEQNKLLRIMPLFVKKAAMKMAFKKNGDRNSSTILSNLGNVVLPPEMEQYVTRLDFLLGSLSYNKVTCACLTYKGRIRINFTRSIKEATVERNFFVSLVKMGIPVKIESNQRY